MPKTTAPLTWRAVKALKKTTSLGGVPGFTLRIRENRDGTTSKTYILRPVLPNGTRLTVTLGAFDALTYAEATQKAHSVRAAILKGEHIKEEKPKRKEQENGLTVAELFYTWQDEQAARGVWKNPAKEVRDNRSRFNSYLPSLVRDAQAVTLTADTLAEGIREAWTERHESATRMLKALECAYEHAIDLGRIPAMVNPAKAKALSIRLPVIDKDQNGKHHGALPVEEIPAFFAALLDRPALSPAAGVVAFAILTAARSGEALPIKWEDIDLEKGLQRIPRENTKTGGALDRYIPLSSQAVDVLKRMPDYRGQGVPYVFVNMQNPTAGHISPNAYWNLLKRMHTARQKAEGCRWLDLQLSKQYGYEVPMTIHGTARATFKAWAKDGKTYGHPHYPESLLERCLDHAEKYGGAYDRTAPKGDMREVFEEWGKYCFSLIAPKK